MDVELLEIREHMGRFAPFDALSDELLDEVASHVEVAYFQAGAAIHQHGDEIHDLHYIRSGAVEIFRRNGELYNRLSEGDIFGHFSLLRSHRVSFPARAIEDTLIYFIPDSIFSRLCEEDEHFADFVEVERPRLEATVEQYRKNNNMMITRVRKLLTRRPVMIETSASVQEAAQRMNEENVTSVLVFSTSDATLDSDARRTFVDEQGQSWTMVGILTDLDFRTRVLAAGLPANVTAGEILHGQPITIQSDESVHEAMLCMLRNNIQHLPVLHRRRPVGVLHLSDIIRYETHSSLYLVSSIFNQTSAKELARLGANVREAFVHMIAEGANSQMVGSALATIGRSFTRRLLELAEAELGPPPVPYCFMALGSMARNEQSIVTDQDNALVLDDRFDPAQHDAYFVELAKRVTNGLDACGYTLCKGDIMATNDRWRQPLAVWKRYFSDWIDQPSPERLLHSSIFFDLDSVHGEEAFVEQLQDLVAEKASQSPPFLAAMARNALNRTPPLGFFRTFVMEQDGKHNNSINLKRRGTAPMVDLIRVHALACGSRAQNSFERLDDIAKTQLLPEGSGERIRYALEFISMVRLRHQVLDIEQERAPDNNVEPENLSDSERHNLKEAFHVLSNAQKFLGFRYPISRQR
ncbi:cyclic nucleotide-binding/CBS domain-containing protein [Halomonas shantousis]